MKKILLQSLLLCLPVLAGLQVSAQNNCLQGWRYSRPVSIRNFIFGLLNDWQVKVTIDTQTLIANGQMNADGSDIRFTTSDCCTQMPYWIQENTWNTPSTVIWTRVPQLMSLDTTWIQMYYGNPAATTPQSNIDLVHFSIGNDSMGTDTATPGITVTTQEYTFPIASRTVRWKIYAQDTMRLKFKVANDTNMVTGTSPFFTVPDDTVGFFTFDRELVVVAGGHPGWFTSTGGKFLNSCAPVSPCPGSCGHAVYRTLDQGVFGALDDDTCGVFPSMRVWYRRSAFVDPATTNWPEFDREQPFSLSSPSGTTICFKDTIQLYANSLPGATYQWYFDGNLVNGATDTMLVVTQDGYYYCVADFGQDCQSFSSDTITINYSSPQVDLGPDHLRCTNGSDTITAGGWFQSFLWSDNSTGSSLIVNASGTYWVEATDSFNCTDTDTVTIQIQPLPNPSITLQGSNQFCRGESANLIATDTAWYAYQWLPNGSTSGNIIVMDSGTYSVIVWDRYFCSDTSAAVTIGVYPDPVLNLGQDIGFCGGDSATLDAGTGWASVLWPDSTTAQTYVTNTTGDYVAIVVDTNGCSTRDTVNVVANPNPNVDLGPSDTLCAAATVTLDAGPNMASYAWTNGATTQAVNVGPGAYSVTIIDSNGCQATSNIIYLSVYPGLGAVAIGGDLTGLAATSAPNYQWYLDGNPISGAVDSFLVPDAAGTYHVEVTDPYGCANATSNAIEIVFDTINDITADDVPQGFSPNGDGINDVWEIIDITAYPNTSVIIMNRWGSEVYSRAPYDNTFNGQGSNGKDLPDGTYFYILRLGDGREYSDYLIINR